MSRTRCRGRAVEVWFVAGLFMLTMIGACDDSRAQGRTATGGDAAGERSPSGFNGVFHATIDGQRTMINLSERDGRVSGTIGTAVIAAQSDGARASGDLKDAATGAVVGGVELSLDRDRLELLMTVLHPASGQRHEMPPVVYTRGAAPPIAVMLDAQVVGRWRHTWTSESVETTGAVSTWLILHPDGSIEQGRSRGDGPTALSLSGTGDEELSGRWRTSDRVLHVSPTGQSHWIALAGYEVDGEQLRLTYNNGSRQVFRRE